MDKSRPLPVYQKPRPVAIKIFFAPLRAVPMEGAEVSDEASSSENTDKGRPPPTVLTSEANLLSLQRSYKSKSGLTHKGMVRSDMSKPALIFFSLQEYTQQNTLSKF
jgi:hypothetical protein